jgi:hypothetical protein
VLPCCFAVAVLTAVSSWLHSATLMSCCYSIDTMPGICI